MPISSDRIELAYNEGIDFAVRCDIMNGEPARGVLASPFAEPEEHEAFYAGYNNYWTNRNLISGSPCIGPIITG